MKTKNFLIFLLIASSSITLYGQDTLSYKKHYFLTYKSEEIRPTIAIEEVFKNNFKPLSKELERAKRDYMKLHKKFKKHPKRITDDLVLQKNFEENIDVVYLLFFQELFIYRRSICNSELKFIVQLERLQAIMKGKKQTNSKELNDFFVSLDSLLYSLLSQ